MNSAAMTDADRYGRDAKTERDVRVRAGRLIAWVDAKVTQDRRCDLDKCMVARNGPGGTIADGFDREVDAVMLSTTADNALRVVDKFRKSRWVRRAHVEQHRSFGGNYIHANPPLNAADVEGRARLRRNGYRPETCDCARSRHDRT